MNSRHSEARDLERHGRPKQNPKAARTAVLPRRAQGVVYAVLLQPKCVSIDVGVVNTAAL